MPLDLVAPHWGAWIEITGTRRTIGVTASHPTGVRGLKYARCDRIVEGAAVAPHWGAWIEIKTGRIVVVLVSVAPHWGAWIDM